MIAFYTIFLSVWINKIIELFSSLFFLSYLFCILTIFLFIGTWFCSLPQSNVIDFCLFLCLWLTPVDHKITCRFILYIRCTFHCFHVLLIGRVLLCCSLCPVSVSDVEAVREGHQSEVLLSIADEFPANRCFTLVFRGRRGNLDLVAESAEEAHTWISGMKKLIENLENMGEREKLDQYPLFSILNNWNPSSSS